MPPSAVPAPEDAPEPAPAPPGGDALPADWQELLDEASGRFYCEAQHGR